MAAKRLILHIGLGKCGTSSLQAFLAMNTEVLKSIGFYYPELEPLDGARQGKVTSGNGALLARSLLDSSHFFATDGKQARLENLEQNVRLREENVVLLSSEFFSMLDERQARELIDIVNGWGREVTVVCYVRRQDHMALSNYVQGLIAGHSSVERSFSEEVASVAVRFRYSRLLAPWSSLGGANNLVLRVFERSKLVEGDVVLDFLEVMGCAEHRDKFTYPEQLNESLNAVAAYILYLMRKTFPEGVHFADLVRTMHEVDWLQDVRNEALLSAADRRSMVAQFEEDNRAIGEKFGRLEEANLFSPIADGAETGDGPFRPSIEDMLPLVKHLNEKKVQ